jgi:opacity protein-like surface antigen
MSFSRLVMILILCWQASLAWAAPMSKKITAPFHRVHVEGKVNLVIHQTSGPSYAIFQGDECDYLHSEFNIQDDSLVVKIQKDYPRYPYKVEVWVNNLHQLFLRGSVKVSGHHLSSSGLGISAFVDQTIHLDGYYNLTYLQLGQSAHLEMSGIDSKNLSIDMQQKAYAKLEGKMNVCQLNLRDDSWLSLYWVKANRMNLVYGGRSFVQLAGRVNVLDLELYGHARFAGRFLRVDRAFVRTHDYSVAQITAERSQHTLALDASHIDYFNLPSMKTDFMVDSGAVLDLREWLLPYMVTTDTGGVELDSDKVANDLTSAFFRWVATFSIGPAWTNAGETQNLYQDPNNWAEFVADRPSSTITAGELFLGIEKNLPWNLFIHLGVTGVLTSNVTLSGAGYGNSDPTDELFTYGYHINHGHLGLKAKLFKDLPSPVLPWISGSIGIGKNRSSGYSDQGILSNPFPPFADKTVTSFTYTLGAGLQFVYLDNWQFGLGFEFADWGKSGLGGYPEEVFTSNLNLTHLYTKGVMFNLTYVS